jgi:hypothetical protein
MGPTRYRIVVAGELSRRFATAFDGMTVPRAGGQTAITGVVVDQSHLRGLLDRVGTWGWSWSASTPSGTRSDDGRRPAAGAAAGRQARRPPMPGRTVARPRLFALLDQGVRQPATRHSRPLAPVSSCSSSLDLGISPARAGGGPGLVRRRIGPGGRGTAVA